MLPSSGWLKRPVKSDSDFDQMQHRKHVQKHQHDGKAARKLQDLIPGQTVAIYDTRSRVVSQAKVTKKCDEPRSYAVKTPNGSELRRNISSSSEALC